MTSTALALNVIRQDAVDVALRAVVDMPYSISVVELRRAIDMLYSLTFDRRAVVDMLYSLRLGAHVDLRYGDCTLLLHEVAMPDCPLLRVSVDMQYDDLLQYRVGVDMPYAVLAEHRALVEMPYAIAAGEVRADENRAKKKGLTAIHCC